jgi:hypothetical protein
MSKKLKDAINKIDLLISDLKEKEKCIQDIINDLNEEKKRIQEENKFIGKIL